MQNADNVSQFAQLKINITSEKNERYFFFFLPKDIINYVCELLFTFIVSLEKTSISYSHIHKVL